MNCERLIETLNIDRKILDPKKDQTSYKIKYVSNYVNQWLYVVTNCSGFNTVNFIDCMCNAGIYSDGDLSTALEVLLLFCETAKKHHYKQFHLFLNDINDGRILICKRIIETIDSEIGIPTNVNIHFSVQDVNDYLTNTSFLDKYLSRGAATIFYIDPYDIGTVVIDNVARLSQRYYCEITLNVFTSDFVRNKQDDRIKKCIGRDDISDREDLLDYIAKKLKTGHIEYSFAYQFRNVKNTEIYRIFFATPHDKGLEKLKEALWETFGGDEFFKTTNVPDGQQSLFPKEEVQKSQLEYHANNAKNALVKEFSGRTVSYFEINLFLLEKSMLKSTDFISHVIKPLIERGIIKKRGLVKKNNYKEDDYQFQKVIE